MDKLCFLFLLFTSMGFCQNLEETIYVAAENFIAKPNDASFETLIKKEAQFKKDATTNHEYLALVFLQCHKGFFLNRNTQLKLAISTYEDALKRFNDNKLSAISDFDIIESCMKPLGNLYIKTGNYTDAESMIKQYVFLAEKQNKTKHKISGIINLSILYQTIGRHETVMKLTSDYINDPNCSKLQKQKLIEIHSNSQIAIGYFSSYENIPITNNDEKQYKIALQNKDYISALKWFKKVKTERLSNNELSVRYLSKLYVEEAQLHTFLENRDEAIKSLHEAIQILIPNFKENFLPKKTNLYAENTFIDIFDLYAQLQTDLNAALQSYNLSFYVEQLLRDGWTSQNTKITNQTNTRIRSEKCINLIYQTYVQTKDQLLLIKALQYSDNSKASTLKEMFQKKLRLLNYPNDTLLKHEFNLLKTQEHITSLLVNEQLTENRALKILSFNKQLSNISLQLKQLKLGIARKYPDDESVFSLELLQEKLSLDNAVLVEYFYGKNYIYQFIVRHENIILNRIKKPTKTENEIISFINLFSSPSAINNNIPNYTKQAFNLYKLLNFDEVKAFKNVVIIPDGLLNFIPFETFLTQETSTTSFSKMPFVVTSQNIAYNSSISLYLNIQNRSKGKTVLGTFPVFENTNQALNYSVDEANAIKNNIPTDILFKTEATKANFIEKSSDYNILHLSTHASSGDFTTPANLSFYDEKLYLNELYGLNLDANLVVLSACETGVGTLYKSEGAMSISRGFQYAGVQNLLFSLWQINDLSTSQIIESFYKNLNKEKSACIANRQSKLEYLKNESISNIKKSPYYWSAFVYYGKLETTKQQNFIFYIFFGILIILIALFLYFKIKKYGRNTSGISSGKRLH